jgi:hypothetical protein
MTKPITDKAEIALDGRICHVQLYSRPGGRCLTSSGTEAVSTHARLGLLVVLGEVARIPVQHLCSGETVATLPLLKLLVPHLYGCECGKG